MTTTKINRRDAVRSFVGAVVSFILGLVGCARRREVRTETLTIQEAQYVVAVILDLSGSFASFMMEGGKAWSFATHVIDHFFRERLGSQDALVIAQVSATGKPLLWDGEPYRLRQSFEDAGAFHAFLRQKSDPNGSRIYEGLAAALKYVLAYPGVSNGNARSAVLILSDMYDTTGSEEAKTALLKQLAAYGHVDGAVGMYWVDTNLVGDWRTHLQDAGIKNAIVTADIVDNPPLPNFE